MSACRTCGKENQVDAHFCHWCGVAMFTSSATGRLPAQMLLHGGRYAIIKLVGQGGMGAVYKAQDLHSERREVAVKEMSQNGLAGQELQEASQAFTREAELLARLNHRSLPRIYQQFEENGRRYLVMEFIRGVTLEHYWRTCQQRGQHIPVAYILTIGMQLCSVLDYLHNQQPPVIFRDLKPANCMLTPRGQVYLIDFGIARLFKAGKANDTLALGSPGYAPPEQYGKATSPRSDIYSLGAVLHQFLTGDDPAQKPFHFKPFSINISILEDLVMSMVEDDEIRRPANIKSVLDVLQRVAKSEKGEAYSQVIRGAVAGIRQVNFSMLISPSTQDQRLWKSLQGQLEVLIADIPNIRIHHSAEVAADSTSTQRNRTDSADFVLILLSEDFLSSSTCIADVKRVIEQTKERDVKTLSLILRPCAWEKTSLANIPIVLPDALVHLSLYAQEQRILEAARSIRIQLATLMLPGKQTGPMNMLQWLLWQLYRNGGAICPYFVVGHYVLKYIRPSGHAGILLRLFDVQANRAISEYSISSHNSTNLTSLLHIIAPACTATLDVQGIAMRERPQL